VVSQTKLDQFCAAPWSIMIASLLAIDDDERFSVLSFYLYKVRSRENAGEEQQDGCHDGCAIVAPSLVLHRENSPTVISFKTCVPVMGTHPTRRIQVQLVTNQKLPNFSSIFLVIWQPVGRRDYFLLCRF
jgi:hypothetical protein